MTPTNCCYPNDVTPQWLSDVLVHAGINAKVSDFSMKPIGTGQLGQNIRFELQYSEGEGPSSLVGKFASDDPTSRETGIAVNDYLKEVLFYQQLAGSLDVTLPKIYFSAIRLEQPDEFVILMQDLSPAVQGDQLLGCDADTASLAMKELAGIAGPRWCDPSLKDIAWLSPPPIENASPGELFDMLMPGFIARYEDSLSKDHLELVLSLGKQFSNYADPEPEIFTIAHIDYRLDNMMFGGPNELTIVDWAPGLGSGAGDAAYFMGTGMEAQLRRKDERHLIKEYHDRLLAYNIDNYSFDKCWLDYRRRSFGGLIMAVIASMIVEQTERGDQMFMTMARRSSDMALELDALELLK